MQTVSALLNFLETSPWFQQLAAILIIIGIPIALLKLIIYKARHKIFFRPKETYQEVKLLDYPNKPQSLWLHLMVKNKGYEISKNAEAYLSEIWFKKNDTSYKKLDIFRAPVKLKWAHEEDIYPIDILPRETRRLDICFICKNIKILYLEAKGFPSGTVKNTLIPADYLFIIKVASKNSLYPAKFILNVVWDGRWRTIRGDKYVKTFKIFKKPVRSFSVY